MSPCKHSLLAVVEIPPQSWISASRQGRHAQYHEAYRLRQQCQGKQTPEGAKGILHRIMPCCSIDNFTPGSPEELRCQKGPLGLPLPFCSRFYGCFQETSLPIPEARDGGCSDPNKPTHWSKPGFPSLCSSSLSPSSS